MVGLVLVADRGDRGRRQVVRVRGRARVLERLVVRNVVGLRVERFVTALSGAAQRDAYVVSGAADGLAILGLGRPETPLEEAPGDVLVVEQVADVLAGELDLVTGRAVIAEGLRVADNGALIVARVLEHCRLRERLATRHELLCHTMGLAGDQVQRARCGRSEGGVVGVVAHRVLLRVVPQRRDGVAVVVVHDHAGRAEGRRLTRGDLGVLHELVHLRGVEGGLLVFVLVVLVAGDLLIGTTEPGRLGFVRVVRQQVRRQTVDLRRARLRGELGAIGVRRIRVGAEVVIEGYVLLEDHHHVLNRRGSADVRRGGLVRRAGARCGSERQQRDERSGSATSSAEAATSRGGHRTSWSIRVVVAGADDHVTAVEPTTASIVTIAVPTAQRGVQK